jgi:hypothetical protein
MKAIINGKTYDTDTATEICNLPCQYDSGNFRYHSTKLYLTSKGALFLSGRGGPLSMWRQAEGSNGWRNGSGINVLTCEEARSHMESAACTAEDFELCKLSVEEG